MGMARVWWIAVLLGALLVACGDDDGSGGDGGSGDGDSGDGDSGDGDGDGDSGDGDGDGDGDNSAPPVELLPCDGSVCFQEVFDDVLFNTPAYRCADAFCHGIGAGDLFIIDKQSAYEALVTVAAAGPAIGEGITACADTGLARVEPGDAEASLLFLKVSETMPPCGEPMPQDPALMLTTEHIELMRTWIDEGAGYE